VTHTFAVSHAPCNIPPSQLVDPRLPGQTEEAGMNCRKLIVIPKNTPELMGYCNPFYEGAGPGDGWCSVALWDILFDKLA
jgi:hypothetical protein